MKIAIVGDKQTCVEVIKKNLENYDKYKRYNFKVDIYDNGETFLSHYNAFGRFDIIFMDIEIEDVNGIDIVSKIREIDKDVVVIFISNQDCYVAKAFRVGAFQYFKKPINEKEFEIDFTRAIEWHNLKHPKYEFQTDNSIVILEYKDIIAIEVYQKKIKIYSENGIFTENPRGSIAVKEEQFKNYNFIRCHRSYLINVSKILMIDKNKIYLKNGKEIPVSRYYYKYVLEASTIYLNSCKI